VAKEAARALGELQAGCFAALAQPGGSDPVNITPTRSDARELPYEDDSFDAAYLVAVLGEIPDQNAALRELARVLKPGGRLVVGELVGDPPALAGSAHRVVQHLLLDVEDVQLPAGCDPRRSLQRVVAGPGTDLENAVAGLGRQGVLEPGPGDEGMWGLDPRALSVGAGRGVAAPPPRPGQERCRTADANV